MKTTKKHWFCPLFGLKIAETLFFAQKYLTRYTLEMFFEEYINFKNFHYLRHYGVLPVQSFKNHICPQPPGLGLKLNTLNFS
jgi:hypothetical protein